MKAQIDNIKIGERSRKDMGDMDELMASIREIGLLSPITVSADMVLVAGERRLTAVKRLGWTEIPAHVVSGMDDAVSIIRAERDENTCRKEMTPEELVDMAERLRQAVEADSRKRQAEGQKLGGEVHFQDGDAFRSIDRKASEGSPSEPVHNRSRGETRTKLAEKEHACPSFSSSTFAPQRTHWASRPM